ncbi:MAG: TylF/MycF/NovP-related O-methyltransferase, partial [bacterium]|nr:TylF/MycF/NovP-related O-methyltransferase [bacterium]
MSLWNWIVKRYPGLKFLREYSPKTAERREILRKIMNFVAENNLGGGDYLEFGVYKAGNFVEAVKTAKQKRKMESMRFHAFDSFQGLPEPRGIDLYSEQWTKGQVSSGENDFREALAKSGADMNRVSVTTGWFKDTLNEETKKKLNIEKAAVIWIDCDLYEST